MSKLIDLGAIPLDIKDLNEEDILDILNQKLNAPKVVEAIHQELIDRGISPVAKEDMH